MANYLYNGVELPDINTVWTDKETYPYATVMGSMYLILHKTKPIYSDGKVAFGGVTYRKNYQLVDGVWNSYASFASTSDLDGISWSSVDILDEAGTVYLVASDPVPVVTPEIDPNSMLQGWIVGRRIAGQRK